MSETNLLQIRKINSPDLVLTLIESDYLITVLILFLSTRLDHVNCSAAILNFYKWICTWDAPHSPILISIIFVQSIIRLLYLLIHE